MATETTGRSRSRTLPRAPGSDGPSLVAEKIARAAQRPSALKRAAKWVAFVGAPVVLLSVIAVAIVYVRMLHGPISLNAFTARIAAGITAELDGLVATVDDAVLTLAEGQGFELRLINLKISEPDGDPVASAPLAAVTLSADALWRFAIVPERVSLIEPKVSLIYSRQRGLSMSFDEVAAGPNGATPTEAGEADQPQIQSGTTTAPKNGTVQPQTDATQIDLARAFADATSRARRGESASAHLKEIGVRNATVTLDYEGHKSTHTLEDGGISLVHGKRRSIIQGRMTLRSGDGPWSVEFRTEDSEKADFIKLQGSVSGVKPAALAAIAPQFAVLQPVAVPIDGTVALELSNEGTLKTAAMAFSAGRGRIILPSMPSTPLNLDKGVLKVDYDATTRVGRIMPSEFKWGDSHITFVGSFENAADAQAPSDWVFDVRSESGALAAEEFGVAAMPIDAFSAKGRIIPQAGLMQLSALELKAGGGTFTAQGDLVTGAEMPSTRIEAQLSPVPLETIKVLWPRAAAHDVRDWVGKHLTGGRIKGASFRMLSGTFLKAGANAGDLQSAGTSDGERISMTLEAGDLVISALDGAPPITAPKALLRLENKALEITVPDAQLGTGPKAVPLKGGRFTVISQEGVAPVGELAFKSQTTLPALLEIAAQSKLGLPGLEQIASVGIDGKVDGQIKILLPLASEQLSGPPKAEGKVRISDIRGKPKGAKVEVQGGAIDIDITSTGVLATGDVIVNGVVAKINAQRILDAPQDLQPPIRIMAKLDNSDRIQLGLDVNHLIQGDAAFEITISQTADGKPVIHGRGDLTNAELMFEDVAWTKPPGKTATLDFDVVAKEPAGVKLDNFRVVGENIAIEGSLDVDPDGEVRVFSFPNFSLNVVSRLEIEGNLNSKNIWQIRAKGSTFDAKDLFRSLLSLGKSAASDIKPLRPSEGVDFTGEIASVLGNEEVSLRSAKIKLSERKDLLTVLEVDGTLDGGKPLVVRMKPETGRKIFAESLDAGQVFKLTGFYPNIQGGRLKLEVDLDGGSGAAEKSGVLWTEDFKILGDTVLQDLYATAEAGGTGADGEPKTKKREVREVFEFSIMKVPFSVGHGQFVLGDSYLRGPVMGVSIRGKVDFSSKRLALGGTYVPLQGINSAFCEIPLFGPIVTGFDCQGVFGITYAIQGSMERPEVLVNPLSMFTPGILRGFMEMTGQNPVVQPRDDKQKTPASERVRASSSPALSGSAAGEPQGRNATIDGWSSETKDAGAAKPQKAPDKKTEKKTEKKPAQKTPPSQASGVQPSLSGP